MTSVEVNAASEPVLVLVGLMIWPVTILLAIHLLHEPIAEIAKGIARRAVRFSVFQVEIELAPLAAAPPAFDVAIGQLRDAVVATSGPGPLIEGVSLAEGAAFVTVDLGTAEKPRWLTSRLFLLAALLERSRTVRAIVLLEARERFSGIVRPADLRAELGLRFPRYETEFARACVDAGQAQAASGVTSDAFVRGVVQGYLTPGSGVVDFPFPGVEEPKVELTRAGDVVFEHASWIGGGTLRAMLGARWMQGAVRSGTARAEQLRAIIREDGDVVALVEASGTFVGLCDRTAINADIARIAVERSADD